MTRYHTIMRRRQENSTVQGCTVSAHMAFSALVAPFNEHPPMITKPNNVIFLPTRLQRYARRSFKCDFA